jgi:glycosyltransferase involved in cell wall biosynthesis
MEDLKVSIASALKSLNMAPEMHRAHISVCVCTYKRPEMLRHLLTELGNLKTENQFTYSILVADNDEARSAQDTVEEMRRLLPVSIRYFCEPRRNIALARNKVIENVQGEYVALIDDDEFPTETWLLTLFNTCNEYKVDGVLGPVVRHFDETPPAWFKKSKIYDREANPTGEVVRWEDSRTGNALLRRRVVATDPAPFRPEFRAGEDQDFFRRKIEAGLRFIWSADAVVFETIPPARWKRTYILRKALIQGATAALQPNCDAKNIAKSLIAVPLYALIVPFALLAGQSRLMTLLIKLFDHSGKLLMLAGFNPIREEYVSE